MDHPAPDHRHIVPLDYPELRILAWNRDVVRVTTRVPRIASRDPDQGVGWAV